MLGLLPQLHLVPVRTNVHTVKEHAFNLLRYYKDIMKGDQLAM